MPDGAVIDLQRVSKRYGSVQALREVSASIGGHIIGLLGPNGAGKSTLLKVLLGLTPFDGTARVLGRDARREFYRVRDQVGYMPETDSYLPDMNAVELCTYAGELSGLPRSAAIQRAHAALYYANLEDKRYLKVAGYSTGLKQRVKLAQALVHDPELLFLDEPTNGLDPAGREEMLALIAELPAKRDCTIVLSTHLLPDVERLCDQVVVMGDGQVVFTGSIDALRGGAGDGARYEVRAKRDDEKLAARLRVAGCAVDVVPGGLAVSLPAGEGTDLVFREARAAGVQVRHLAPLRVTLEAGFLKALEG